MSAIHTHADAEGVIKYQLKFSLGPAPSSDVLCVLEGWRRILLRLGLVGRDPARYGGLAFGNVSCRAPKGGFFISGSQTGGENYLDPSHYCWVTSCDASANWLQAEGSIRPSSEALSHAAAYGARSDIKCVLHVHAPEIWAAAAILGIPVTDSAIEYGTPAMASAITELIYPRHHDVIAMGGHEDGVLAVGETVESAAVRLINLLRQSLRQEPSGTPSIW